MRSQRNDTSLENAFETFEGEFGSYATKLGVTSPPLSSSWSDALIAFLRSDAAGQAIRAKQVKDTLILDTPGVETYLVARFIQELQTSNRETFGAVIQIYTEI